MKFVSTLVYFIYIELYRNSPEGDFLQSGVAADEVNRRGVSEVKEITPSLSLSHSLSLPSSLTPPSCVLYPRGYPRSLSSLHTPRVSSLSKRVK